MLQTIVGIESAARCSCLVKFAGARKLHQMSPNRAAAPFPNRLLVDRLRRLEDAGSTVSGRSALDTGASVLSVVTFLKSCQSWLPNDAGGVAKLDALAGTQFLRLDKISSTAATSMRPIGNSSDVSNPALTTAAEVLQTLTRSVRKMETFLSHLVVEGEA